MPALPCIPDESIYTVEDFKTLYKEILTGATPGVREIQFADKRTVFRSMTEMRDLLNMMQEAIWGHCANYQSGIGRRTIAVSSKGIC